MTIRTTENWREDNATLHKLQRRVFDHVKDSGLPVAHLMPWLTDRRNLKAAWRRVRRNDGAKTPGVDGMVAADLDTRIDPWLTALADDLAQGRYRPAAIRHVDIAKPKNPKAFRHLGILTIRDRVVHCALKQILEPVFEPLFTEHSFGFRPGRSVPAALDCACTLLAGKRPNTSPPAYAIPLDIADCFDTIDRAWMTEQIQAGVQDPRLLELLATILIQCGQAGRHLWPFHLWLRRPRGLVQGSALSPLLCNLALHPLDQKLAALSRQTAGGVELLRYADDLLLLAHNRRLARRALRTVQTTVRTMRQKLARPIPPIEPLTETVPWLGVELERRDNPWTSQLEARYAVPATKVRTMLERLDEITTPPSARIDPAAFDLSRWIVSINDQLREWSQAYRFAHNASDVFRTVDAHAFERVGELLRLITGQRWPRLRREYRVRLARGFTTWEIDGTRLVVLSSQAPRCPERLIHPPAWMASPRRSHQRTKPATIAIPRMARSNGE